MNLSLYPNYKTNVFPSLHSPTGLSACKHSVEAYVLLIFPRPCLPPWPAIRKACRNLAPRPPRVTSIVNEAKHPHVRGVLDLSSSSSPDFRRVFIIVVFLAHLPVTKRQVPPYKIHAGDVRWQESKVGLLVIANGDPYRPLLVEIFSYKRWGWG